MAFVDADAGAHFAAGRTTRVGLFRWLPLCLAVISIVLARPSAPAAREYLTLPWQMTADRITRYSESEEMVAEGNVVLRQTRDDGTDAMVVRADWLRYDARSASVLARGNLLIKTDTETVTAEEATFALNDQTGVLTDTTVFLAANNLHFIGRAVEKTGAATYRFRDGRITACNTPPGANAPWQIQSSDTKLTLDKYAVLKHATFRIKGVPIVYTPFLILPAKRSRETGLLFPELSSSKRDGLGFLQPLFINLSPSMDVTLFPGFLDNRGPVAGLEYRYVADADSWGTLALNYLRDRTEDSPEDEYKSDGYLRTLEHRYWLRGKADHRFGDHVVARLDLDIVSDRDFLQEFREGMIGYDANRDEFLGRFHRSFQEQSLPFRESTLQLARPWPTMFAGAELRVVDDLDGQADPEISAVQTVPKLLFQGRTALFGSPLQLAWESDYVYYWREQGVGSHRWDLYPRLVSALPMGKMFEGRIAAGLRETFYRVVEHGSAGQQPWVDDRSLARTLWDLEMNAALPLVRDYASLFGTASRLEHLFRPNLVYRYLPNESQEDLPEIDALDRLPPENSFTLQLANYFYKTAPVDGGGDSTRSLGYFIISQKYDIREARRELAGPDDRHRPLSDIMFDLNLRPWQGMRLRYQTSWNVYGQGVPAYELLARYNSGRGFWMSLDYTYERDAAHELNLALQTPLSRELSVKIETTRSLVTDHTVREALSLQYRPHCWSMELSASQTTEDRRFMVVFSLDALGKVFEWGTENI